MQTPNGSPAIQEQEFILAQQISPRIMQISAALAQARNHSDELQWYLSTPESLYVGTTSSIAMKMDERYPGYGTTFWESLYLQLWNANQNGTLSTAPSAAPKINTTPLDSVPAVNVPAVNVPAVNVPAVSAPAVSAPAVSTSELDAPSEKSTEPETPDSPVEETPVQTAETPEPEKQIQPAPTQPAAVSTPPAQPAQPAPSTQPAQPAAPVKVHNVTQLQRLGQYIRDLEKSGKNTTVIAQELATYGFEIRPRWLKKLSDGLRPNLVNFDNLETHLIKVTPASAPTVPPAVQPAVPPAVPPVVQAVIPPVIPPVAPPAAASAAPVNPTIPADLHKISRIIVELCSTYNLNAEQIAEQLKETISTPDPRSLLRSRTAMRGAQLDASVADLQAIRDGKLSVDGQLVLSEDHHQGMLMNLAVVQKRLEDAGAPAVALTPEQLVQKQILDAYGRDEPITVLAVMALLGKTRTATRTLLGSMTELKIVGNDVYAKI